MSKEIICICGSTKFKDKIIQVQRELTLQGYIVIGMHLFSQDERIKLTEEQLYMLKEKHKFKIDMSEAIYVVNPDGYVGDSTKEEIMYAISKGKKIMSLEPLEIPKSAISKNKNINDNTVIILLFAGFILTLITILWYYVLH